MLKKVLIFGVLVILLVGCAELEQSLPEGKYGVYPLDNQDIIPITLEVQGRTFILEQASPTVEVFPTETTPIPTPLPTAIEPIDDCRATNKLTGGINVRSSYSTSSALLGVLPIGQSLFVGYIYDKSASETWAYIQYDVAANTQGWIALKFNNTPLATLEGDCSNVTRSTLPPF